MSAPVKREISHCHETLPITVCVVITLLCMPDQQCTNFYIRDPAFSIVALPCPNSHYATEWMQAERPDADLCRRAARMHFLGLYHILVQVQLVQVYMLYLCKSIRYTCAGLYHILVQVYIIYLCRSISYTCAGLYHIHDQSCTCSYFDPFTWLLSAGLWPWWSLQYQ